MAIHLDCNSSFWGGLERYTLHGSRGYTYLDGSVNLDHWWFSIGSLVEYRGGIPSCFDLSSDGVPEVELWVR